MCQNIRHLNGTIRVRSSTDGTLFQIDLPKAGRSSKIATADATALQ